MKELLSLIERKRVFSPSSNGQDSSSGPDNADTDGDLEVLSDKCREAIAEAKAELGIVVGPQNGRDNP